MLQMAGSVWPASYETSILMSTVEGHKFGPAYEDLQGETYNFFVFSKYEASTSTLVL